MYQALYRKWRPRVFSDVVGQEAVTRTLKKQVAEGRVSHAYLFTGTRGTGKTTCAKILSRAVNCEHPNHGDPCGQCPACVGLENGSFLDVLELDAASNNGVDQVRALRDEAIYAPANVRLRVYIVDEVHMLSTPAFNALLKILEEPPEHLMFILATTELHKVPATILSRCQRYSFRRIEPKDIAARLTWVAAQEQIPLAPDGAELLSRLADGALRDALSLLDQCAAYGQTINSALVLETLGLAGQTQTVRLLECVLNRNLKDALTLFGQLYENGKDAGAVLSELSALVRDLMLWKIAPEGGAGLRIYDDTTLARLGGNVSSGRLLFLASVLQKAGTELYASANRRLDGELCLFRLCDETLSGDLTALEARIERLEQHSASMLTRPASTEPYPASMTTRPASTLRRSETAFRRPSAPPETQRPPIPDAPPWDESAPLPDMPLWDEPAPLPDMPPEPPRMSSYLDAPPEIAGNAPPEYSVPTAPENTLHTQPENAFHTQPENTIHTVSDSTSFSWPELSERCKNRLPAFYGSFVGQCAGVLDGDTLTVYAPDGITLGRLDNDRVRGVLLEESGAANILLRETDPEKNLRELLTFSQEHDIITVKGKIPDN